MRKKRKTKSLDRSRRGFLLTMAGVAVLAPGVWAKEYSGLFHGNKPGKRKSPVSPPGSVSQEHLLHRCTSCHLCIRKCPSKILRPSLLEYGLEGFMQPLLDFRNGFCKYDCKVCSEVCPSGAILSQTLENKRKLQIGLAVYRRENCLSYTGERNCSACMFNCPTDAITMGYDANDRLRPFVDLQKCLGCGACEHVCPGSPSPAFQVEGKIVHKRLK